jgi:hypothetical protein
MKKSGIKIHRRKSMKKRNYLISVVLVLALSTLACGVNFNSFGINTVRGSGTVVTEERPVSAFTRIELSGIGNLVIEVGSEETLDIEAEDNLLEYFETRVRGDTLEIGSREGENLQPTEPIIYNLTVKTLDSISVSGLGNVHLPEYEVDRFSIDISGAGDVNLEGLHAEQLDVSVSGLGSVGIDAGEVSSQTIDISGSGDYNAPQLESRTADVQVSGLGSAELWVTQDLRVIISGSGSVSYAGDPDVYSDISGLGSLNKIND